MKGMSGRSSVIELRLFLFLMPCRGYKKHVYLIEALCRLMSRRKDQLIHNE
jgi:hypothetical protein